jgi:hypothetical protein
LQANYIESARAMTSSAISNRPVPTPLSARPRLKPSLSFNMARGNHPPLSVTPVQQKDQQSTEATAPAVSGNHLTVEAPLSARRTAAKRTSLNYSKSQRAFESERIRLSAHSTGKIYIPECDVLTSTLIFPQVCDIHWLDYSRHPQFLIANGKYVKLIQARHPIGQKSFGRLPRLIVPGEDGDVPNPISNHQRSAQEAIQQLSLEDAEDEHPQPPGASGKPGNGALPPLKLQEVFKKQAKLTTKRTYMEPTNPPNLHSVSVSSDRENFLTASERYIHLWNMENPDSSWSECGVLFIY